MPPPPEEQSFLSRWSRRKADARQEDAAPPPDHPAAQTSAPVPDAVPDAAPQPAAEAAPITEAELAALPRIDDLVPGVDIRAFLRPGVPAALKNAALQKMWLLTPAIRDYRDPAVDYAWDWNTPGGVPGDGVAPSAERAAQMMRDLFDPRPPKPDAVAAVDSPDENAIADLETALKTDTPVVPAPVSETEAVSDKVRSNQSDTAEPIVRRRHGGALPS